MPKPVIEFIFDGPPGHEGARFVEVERNGQSVDAGDWYQRADGLWAFRLRESVFQSVEEAAP